MRSGLGGRTARTAGSDPCSQRICGAVTSARSGCQATLPGVHSARLIRRRGYGGVLTVHGHAADPRTPGRVGTVSAASQSALPTSAPPAPRLAVPAAGWDQRLREGNEERPARAEQSPPNKATPQKRGDRAAVSQLWTVGWRRQWSHGLKEGGTKVVRGWYAGGTAGIVTGGGGHGVGGHGVGAVGRHGSALRPPGDRPGGGITLFLAHKLED